MSPPSHSSTQIIIVGLVASLITARFAWQSRSAISRLFLITITLCFLVPTGIVINGMNPWLLDARYRTYREFYWSLRKNMSRTEVMAVMNEFYPPGEARSAPTMVEDTASRLGFYMHPEKKSEPTQEAIFLEMEEGRVTRTQYIPDRTQHKNVAEAFRPPPQNY